MNYIAEINRFHELLPQSRMTPSSIALWYGLMHIFNKAGWPEEKAVWKTRARVTPAPIRI